jgi:hypothetical protein
MLVLDECGGGERVDSDSFHYAYGPPFIVCVRSPGKSGTAAAENAQCVGTASACTMLRGRRGRKEAI